MRIKILIPILVMLLFITGCESEDVTEVDDGTPITLGTFLVEDDQALADAKSRFEAENPGYRIEVREYNSEADLKRFLVELTTGKAPDIIDLGNLPAKEYIELGLFEDLTPYYEKDQDVSLGDLIDPIAKAMRINGGVYYTASSFGINSLAAKKDDIGDATGWTVSEMSAYIDSKPKDVQILPGNSKSEILGLFTHSSMDDFIDWEKGTCSFDTDEFKHILEIADRGLDDLSEKYPGETTASLFSSGKLCFYNLGVVGAPELAALKGRLKASAYPIGFPCNDRQGSEFILKEQYGISSVSEHKDMAWRFLKIIMSKEHQYKVMYPMYLMIPTRKDCYDMYIRAITETKTYEDEEGNVVYPLSAFYGDSETDTGYEQGPLLSEDVKLFENLIGNTHRVCQWEHSLSDIIKEEAEKYFKKERSLDETAKVINDRISTYISERK